MVSKQQRSYLWLFLMLFVFLFQGPQPGYSAEAVKFNEVFQNYEKKWEINEELSSAPPTEYGNSFRTDIEILVGTDYFGIYEPHKVYKHFNNNGELLCELQPKTDYSWVRISPVGNRIMIMEQSIPIGTEQYRFNVYNENGNYLFSTPFKSFDLISTDSGSYYFAQPNMETAFPLQIFNDKGEILETDYEQWGGWHCKPLDEERMIYANHDEVMIMEIADNRVITKRPMSDIATKYWLRLKPEVGPGGKVIALWSRIEIVIVDDNLNVLGKVVMPEAEQAQEIPKRHGGTRMIRRSDIWIEEIAISKDSNYILYSCRLSKKRINKMYLVTLAGETISDFTIGYLPMRIECDKDYIWAWSRDSRKNPEGFVDSRFFSIIYRINGDTKGFISQNIMKNRVHPIGNQGDFLEFGDGFVRRWSEKGK